jgi:hypothetical protein
MRFDLSEKSGMSRYREIIKQATGCTDAEAVEIENVMRDVIFHSTLDWQTRWELEEAARLALEVIRGEALLPRGLE